MMLEPTVTQKLGFDLIKEAQKSNQEDKTLSDETLLKLYSIFGGTLTSATELLEKCKITKYQTSNGSRQVYKIGLGLQRYTVYQDINFCGCEEFKEQVLVDRSALTCKHVLAVKLNQINGGIPVRVETITDSQFVDLLNAQGSTQ